MERRTSAAPVPKLPASGLHIDDCWSGQRVAMYSEQGPIYAGYLEDIRVKPPRVTFCVTHLLRDGKWKALRPPNRKRGRVRSAGQWIGLPHYLVALGGPKPAERITDAGTGGTAPRAVT